MDWLMLLAVIVPLLEWLLSKLKAQKPEDVLETDKARLSHAAGLCERIVDESVRLGVQPEVDPREWSK